MLFTIPSAAVLCRDVTCHSALYHVPRAQLDTGDDGDDAIDRNCNRYWGIIFHLHTPSISLFRSLATCSDIVAINLIWWKIIWIININGLRVYADTHYLLQMNLVNLLCRLALFNNFKPLCVWVFETNLSILSTSNYAVVACCLQYYRVYLTMRQQAYAVSGVQFHRTIIISRKIIWQHERTHSVYLWYRYLVCSSNKTCYGV